ncbi:MAG TPA: alkaline phosphatase family protein [Candidatus Dormibacteraeota bacterium]|nr:alkaline phosphatase family protein [Candidatus Dormibacteraeota bacterium]
MRTRIALAGFGAVLAMIVGSGSVAADSNRSDQNRTQHVFVIMMENTGYNSLIGNPNAPWINSAANTYGLATSYFGVSHPSQPNYIAATSGGTNGVLDDTDKTINVQNVIDQLERKDKTWKAYMQSLSLCNGNKLAHACGNQLYERKHNPFVSYLDVQSSPARMAKIVDLSQLGTDLSTGRVPNFVWISPDQCSDMHGRAATPADPCDFSQVQTLISTGDKFLHDTVGAIMSSRAWTRNSVIFVTWDESDFTGNGTGPFGFGDTSGCCDANPGGGHVVTLVISHSNHGANQSDVSYNHYSLLRTIQDGWRLGCLGFTCDKAHVPAMTELTSQEH